MNLTGLTHATDQFCPVNVITQAIRNYRGKNGKYPAEGRGDLLSGRVTDIEKKEEAHWMVRLKVDYGDG